MAKYFYRWRSQCIQSYARTLRMVQRTGGGSGGVYFSPNMYLGAAGTQFATPMIESTSATMRIWSLPQFRPFRFAMFYALFLSIRGPKCNLDF
jgi:hypothetical protein